MFEIAKTFRFAAAHHLPQLPEGHKCRNVHGHNYTVEVRIASEDLDLYGFVVDYGDLAPVRTYLDSTFDHRDLNAVMPVAPTAELLAVHIHAHIMATLPLPADTTVAVRVSETPDTWAEYRA
jgi:6-pyruvoyltetrahydropterin/6-carboxytetrahydropterin synthase